MKKNKGHENLIPVQSVEEAREKGRKGGIKSGESKRKRKALKDSMNALLDLPIVSQRDFNKVARMGIDIEDIDNSQLIVLALFNRAKSGDVFAIKELRNLIGEDDINKHEITVTRESAAELSTEELRALANEIIKQRK